MARVRQEQGIHHNVVRLGALASLVVSLSACDCSTGSPDAGPIDAPSTDTASTLADAHVPVPSDARPTPDDAGDDVPDGGPDDPGWVALPGLPAGCVIERALHPERLLRNEWAPCGPGCEYLVRDERFGRGVNPSGWHDGIRGYFSTNQGLLNEPERERHRIIVFAATDGQVLGAWRGPNLTARPLCMPGQIIVGDGYAVLDVVFWSEALKERRLYYAPIDEIGSLVSPTVIIDSSIISGGVVQRGSVSRHVFAAELQPGGQLLLVRPDGSVERQRVAGNPQIPQVVGHDVFVDVFDGPTGHIVMHRARFGEGNAPFIAQSDAHVAGALASDGQLTWYQAYGPGRISSAERIELWTAPLQRTRALLEPRMVRVLTPGVLSGFMKGFEGSGIHATFESMVRLSDGAVLRYPRGAGRTEDVDVGGNFGHLWIDGGEVALAALLLTGGPGQGTVRRDRIDGLTTERGAE